MGRPVTPRRRPRRRPRHGDDGSLVLAMLLITVAMMLAGVLVPALVTQFKTSRYDARRDHSLDAAQGGLDIMVGRFRDSVNGTGNGVPNKLPCTAVNGPMTGSMDPNGDQTYSAKVYYFATDPSGHTDGGGNWITDTTKQLACTAGGLKSAPAYAVIVSTGKDAGNAENANSGRTVEITYAFKRSDANALGGLIRSYQSNPALCLDAGSVTPAVGTIPTMQPCDATAKDQLWAYNQNDTVSLAASLDPATNMPTLCLDATYPRNPNQRITLQKCYTASASTSQKSEQRWSFQGTFPFTFITTNSNGTESILNGPGSDNANARCWTPSTLQFAGASLMLGPCVANSAPNYNPRMLLVYDSSVGAGNASALVRSGGGYANPDGYLSNFGQFGRCLDPPNGAVPNTSMIAYFCRSTPDPNALPREAQLWSLPSVPSGATQSQPGPIHLIYDFDPNNQTPDARSGYCITSPGMANGFVSLIRCNSSNNNQKWTVFADTGDYTSSFRIVDWTKNLCLQPDPNSPSPDVPGGVSKIAVKTCSDDVLQKWNAPPTLSPFQLKDYHEK